MQVGLREEVNPQRPAGPRRNMKHLKYHPELSRKLVGAPSLLYRFEDLAQDARLVWVLPRILQRSESDHGQQVVKLLFSLKLQSGNFRGKPVYHHHHVPVVWQTQIFVSLMRCVFGKKQRYQGRLSEVFFAPPWISPLCCRSRRFGSTCCSRMPW